MPPKKADPFINHSQAPDDDRVYCELLGRYGGNQILVFNRIHLPSSRVNF